MKTKILITATAIMMAMNFGAYAQAPEKLNYQGIARDSNGDALANQALGVKISILHNSTVDYSETHSVTTNGFGLYTLIIGDGTPVFGGMASIDWSSGNKFVKVEIDPTGGTNYTDLGSTELLSVPYALYAAESPSAGGPPTGAAGGDLTGNYPNPNIANNVVTTGKIAANAVTGAKIAPMGATTGQVLEYDGANWAPTTLTAAPAGWELAGNTATATDFIGTTNTVSLRFKVNNKKAGEISPVSESNTSFGYQTLFNNTTGNANTAIGFNALLNNTTGIRNTATGSKTLESNTDGRDNLAIGYEALRNNTAGDYNTATGSWALYSNTTGNDNTANGYRALYANTTGIGNTANGDEALNANTTGNNNAAFGALTLTTNTTGTQNSAFGASALRLNTTGDNNAAFGLSALRNNTTGFSNSAFGLDAMYDNTTGQNNSAFGTFALNNNTTGQYNTAIGRGTLSANTTGDYNTAVGYATDVSAANLINATAIGALAQVSQSNSLVLGSINGVNSATEDTKVGIGTTSPLHTLHVIHHGAASATNLDGFTLEHDSALNNDWTFHVGNSSGDLYLFANGVEQGKFDGTSGSYSATSDARLKKNLSSLENVLPKVMQLKPLSYQFKRQEDGTKYLGFIAQEVEKIFPFVAKEPSNEDGAEYYTMDYSAFGVIAIKAIQEQQKIITEQQEAIDQQKQLLQNQQAALEKIQERLAKLEGK